tara:strand:- start:66 stop:803 length:738 start_codon:yes stop_codon:yes gene_type:complete
MPEEVKKTIVDNKLYSVLLDNVKREPYDDIDNALNKMIEEMEKLKQENKELSEINKINFGAVNTAFHLQREFDELKEENEELKEENKKLLSNDKNQSFKIAQLRNMINNITELYKNNKQQDDKILYGDKIIQAVKVDEPKKDKPKDKPKNKQFKNGCIVRNRYTREIYKLMSDTKTQFRVIKLRCTSWNNEIVDNKINIAPEAGKDKIKWIKNKNITKKRLEDEYYIISDKKNIIFEKPEYEMIL